MSTDESTLKDAERSFWAICCAAGLSRLGTIVAGMSMAPDLTGRFLVADRARQIGEELDEARSHIDEVTALRRVEPLVSSVAGYVPCRDWVQVLLRDHVLVGLAGDFLARVEEHLDAAMLPADGTWSERLVLGAGARARWDAELRRRLEDPATDRSSASLFARKFVGEVLSVAQRIAAVDSTLTSALTATTGGELDDLDAINEIMADVLADHDRRMTGLGLEP